MDAPFPRSGADGVLLTPIAAAGHVQEAADGFPVLHVGQPVTNNEVVAAIGQERAER